MNFLQRAAFKFATGKKSFTFGNSFIQGDELSPLPGVTWETEGDWSNTALLICLQTLTTNFNEPPIRVMRDIGEKEPVVVRKHPLTTLLRRPNPFYTGRAMQTAWMTSRGLNGNGYLRKVRTRSGGAPVELWNIPYWAIEPVVSPGSPWISHYRYTASGLPSTPIPVEDIVHLRWGTNPQQGKQHLGIDPLKMLGAELKADTEAALYTFYTLKNPAPGLLLVPGKDVEISPDNIDKIKERITNYTTGRNRGGVLALTEEMALTSFGHSPADVGVGGLRMIPEARVSAFYGVPTNVAGLSAGLEHSTYNNVKESKAMFTENTLSPLWVDIGAEYDAQLLADFDGLPVMLADGTASVADSSTDYVAYDQSVVKALQEDENKRHERLRADWEADGLTHGEYRTALGHDKDPARENMYYSELVGKDPQTAAAKTLIETVKRRTNEARAMLEDLNAGDQDS